MNTKSLNQRIENAETSASTETKNKENMRKGTFTLPTLQEALYVVKRKCTTANVVIYAVISFFYSQKFFC